MLTSDFDYYLPEDKIAQKPLKLRDHSRLLVLNTENEDIGHECFYNLPNYLKAGDTLVFNDTKVMPARLLGQREDTGGKVEVFLLSRIGGDDWEVLVKPGKKARPGTRVIFEGKCGNNQEKIRLECEILSLTNEGGRIVRFFYQGVFESILDVLGQTPLPPYIKEKLEDKNRYQTVYAAAQGSSAAPTAGLHFTEELINKLKNMKVNIAFITLHVGLGTFRPVNTADIREHVMHREYYSIPEETIKIIETTKKNGGKIIAVGTTAVRTLEAEAQKTGLSSKSGWTDIFIYPGYKFRVIDGMITNFHLPKSTLIMLVCALAGKEKVLNAYKEAVKCDYRFFSFGDAMLIL